MAQRLLQDPEEDGWERSDFPIVCETCLGPNPYVRMQKIDYGGACHISGRPYTVFRWRPGNDARYKKTIICQEVAKAKNVCQVCLLDLDYSLPVQVRDKALGVEEDGLPESVPGKEYALTRMQTSGELDDRSRFASTGANELINKLSRNQPYYKRNQAKICSFFVRGECKRGAECPYRHEMPTTGPLAEQNIRDRYYGTNDPVAEKMLARAEAMKQSVPPADRSIMTLFVGGVGENVSEDDLRGAFYPFGEIKALKKVESRNCAFVTYTTRDAAEHAMKSLGNAGINVKGDWLKVLWGKPKQPSGSTANAGGPSDFASLPASRNAGHISYPSMDPLQAGTRAETRSETKRRPNQDQTQGSNNDNDDSNKRSKVEV